MENEVKDALKKHLKGARSSTIETLERRIGILPNERIRIATDIGVALAGTSLRAAVEFFRATPEISRLLDTQDMRLWGEIGRRLAATSAETAIEFFRTSRRILQEVPDEMRTAVLRLASKQAALSANTAVECFKSSASTIRSIGDYKTAAEVLNICLELARHSVKHSFDLLRCAPTVISELRAAPGSASPDSGAAGILGLESDSRSADAQPVPGATNISWLVERAISLTSAFAYKSGGTAAEFFAEVPRIAVLVAEEPSEYQGSLEKLFSNTETYLERSGGVALQYYKAASRVLLMAGEEAFDRWTQLARRVAFQGNAASYHFMKASPQIIADLGTRAGKERRSQVVAAVLEVVEEIGEVNSAAAVECFKASPMALSAATLTQFGEWARRGLDISQDSRRLQAYYSLESKGSQDALFNMEGGLTLDSIAQTLRLYVEGLSGRVINIAPLSSMPEESRIGDGNTIYLPSVVAEFEAESENFRMFKVMAAHAAGQIEFGTYARSSPSLLAALRYVRNTLGLKEPSPASGTREARPATEALPNPEAAGAPAEAPLLQESDAPHPNGRSGRRRKSRKSPMPDPEIGFVDIVSEFPNPETAMRLFTTIENGRIDYLLRSHYRGIRRDLDFVLSRMREARPGVETLPADLLPFELLFQVSMCGGATFDAQRAYPAIVCEMERVMTEYARRPDATVGDSLVATCLVYKMLVEQPSQSDRTTDDPDLPGQESEGSGSGDSSQDANADSGQDRRQVEIKEDPLSFWASNLTQDISPESDLLGQFNQTESAEQDLEKGDRSFYYDEWDRDLADYRTRWCRVIERASSRGSRGFVEMVRSRYSGIISSVRYQFQLLRPENLRRIRGEIDGEDYDLQAVIDYALDKRSTGLIDDRLYTRKLRRERDVAVSFLLDMSSSTARTISRYPNKPYTQPGQRIIDIEKEGLVLMSEALEAVGDAYSMQGFTSEGRRNVKFYVIKDFSEHYSAEVERRIGGITYQNNTRLGAAIRHAAWRLGSREARTKLLIVLSDGRPYDHDYGDSRYAREDTRMALRQTRLLGITPFCITIDRESEDQLKDMYGEVGYTIIDEVLSLPERLPGIYTRLTT
jgi:hypothetical protein